MTEPAAMSKDGYDFAGWYKEADFGTKWVFATNTVSADMTLHAKWNPEGTVEYTVKFNANGGLPAPADATVSSGGKVTAPPAMTRTGYEFVAWYEEAGFVNEWVFAANTVSADMTLHAKWEAQGDLTPTVTGVSVSPATVTVPKGGTQQFSATVTGTNNPAQTVTWSITPTSTLSNISTDGLLTVGAGETRTSFTVKATSTVDTSKSGNATVTVAAGGISSLEDIAGVWIDDSTDNEIEIEYSTGQKKWFITVKMINLMYQAIELDGDVISLNNNEGTIKVTLGADEKLTVSEATGDFVLYGAGTADGVYTREL